MTPDEMFQTAAGDLPPPDDVRLLWPQARGELLGFARHLSHTSPITASQLQLAVRMADEYARPVLAGDPRFSRGQWVRVPSAAARGTVVGRGTHAAGEYHYIVLCADGREYRLPESALAAEEGP